MTYMINRNVNTSLDDLFDGFFGGWTVNTSYPAVNIYEDANSYYLEAELPGYESKDVDIHVEKHVLRISSNKVSKENDKKYVMCERRNMKFERNFSLPEHVDEGAISAEFKNGMLKISVPKVPEIQPRKIEVKVSA